MRISYILVGLLPTVIFFIGFMSFNTSDVTRSPPIITELTIHTPLNMLTTLDQLIDQYNYNRAATKAVLLLLDGFRYDYMARMAPNNVWPTNKIHRYDKVIVEPPTSTSQKVKTIICGTQSVLSEIAKSFTSMRVFILPGLRGQPDCPAQRHRSQDRIRRRRHMD